MLPALTGVATSCVRWDKFGSNRQTDRHASAQSDSLNAARLRPEYKKRLYVRKTGIKNPATQNGVCPSVTAHMAKALSLFPFNRKFQNACKKAANNTARKTIKSKRSWPFTIDKAGREKDTPIGQTACRSTR